MKFIFFICTLFIFCNTSYAGKIYGHVRNDKSETLAFSSIIVKGTTQGVSANLSGEYQLQLAEGEYVLIAQHVGYKSSEKKIVVTKADQLIDFQLSEQQYELGNIVVKNGEDPAYEIIRNAIKKRNYYENEIKKFETEVYIKGQLKLRNYPKKFMGEEVDFEDGDTSKRKMIFLSETVAKYSVDLPDRKTEVISTKVSGDQDGFGFSSPQIISFYQNNVNLGILNPRGFVSPIAAGAMNFYRYKFEGSFFEDNKMISRVKVIPRRTFEPLFNGYINIIEGEWRIHSLRLTLLKENQIQIADTVTIEQLYVPLGNVWVIKQQTIYPAIKIFSFDAHGSFVQVYDKFNLKPVFPKKFFGNTVLKFYDSANKKPLGYWDSIRPLPLQQEEILDYIKKDSLERLPLDPRYLDSLDRKRNKPNITQLILSGQNFGSEKLGSNLYVDALLDVINYNTVEGAVIDFSPTYSKRFDKVSRRRLSITPTFRYGLSNKRFNANLSTTYTFGKKYFSSISVSGGRKVYQFNNANPVLPRSNTLSSLNWERNFLKLYEAGFGRVQYSQGFGDGFMFGAGLQYQDRIPLYNTTLHKWRDFKDREFTENIYAVPHKAFASTFSFAWQPKVKYIEYPDRKVNIGSKYPRLNLAVTTGIKDLFGSDVDYTKWRFTVSDDLNLKLAGRFSYRLNVGGFLNKKTVYFQDYQHYQGNQTGAAAQYLNSFQLLPYYSLSNTSSFNTTAHAEYHLNGLLTNKIPLFKRLNWFLVGATNLLYLNNGTFYGEGSVGIENILKILRLDYVQSFGHKQFNTSGIKFSLPLLLRGEED
ncbi:MAG: hypothetical protein JWQ96_1361 [Segetibacter sp.]|nr:hypothetical protein [Segetibacter sp.]